jgi:hypothetical protein
MSVDAQQRLSVRDLFSDYVEHLDQAPFGVLERGQVYHSVYYHDAWCGIFKGGICTCSPTVKRYVEPQRQ